MPQAIAAAIVSAVALTGTVATIATAVISLALSIGLNFIAQAIFGKSGVGKPSDGQRIIRLAVGSRVRHYGKVRVGGQLTFYESRNGDLYSLMTMGQGQINAVSEYVLNGKVATVDGSGTVTSISYSRKGHTYNPVSVHAKLGTDDQTAHSQLSVRFTEWTSDHRQRGCSSILLISGDVSSKHFSEVYEGNREPELLATIEASLVYDPRLDSNAGGVGSHRQNDPSTWAYSDNWALAFADYLAHADGYGLGMDMINWANVAEEADFCDELVTTVDARSIRRWRVAGSYKLADDERRAVIKEFLKAGDGFIWQDANGLTNIRCGRWIAPTVHIPEKHIIGCSASLGTDPQDRANEVRTIYMEPELDYTETEAAPLVDEVARSALGRSEVSRFDCYFCPDHNQAQRIGKRILRRLGHRWSLTITTNLFGLNAIGERFIKVTISELDIVAMDFEVTGLKIDPAGLNVEIGLLQVEEDDFSFNAALEEGTPPAAAPSTVVPIVIEEMANLTLSSVIDELNGAMGVSIMASWDEPSRIGLIAQLQYRATGATQWLEMSVSQDDLIASTGIVADGVEYEVQGRLLTISGRSSNWTDPPETITPSAAGSPALVTLLAVAGGVGDATLSWRNPSSANFDHVAIYRHTSDVFGSASQIATVTGGLSELMEYVDTSLAAGTYYWWVTSVDTTSTFESDPAGSVSDAVT